MRPRLWRITCAFLLFVAPAFAGCMGGGDGKDPDAPPTGTATPTPTDGPDEIPAHIAAGTYRPWTVSDHWTYEAQVRGVGTTETTLVYYLESGPEYVVGVPTYAEALHSAVFSTTPMLGRVHQSVLSPHEDGDHAYMFPWHLGDTITDGMRWNTRFYGRILTLTATYDPAVPTPLGPLPGYSFLGVDANDDAVRVTYDYVPEVKWFAHLRVADDEGVRVDLRLKDFSTGYTGPAHFIRSLDYVPGETITNTGLLTTEHTFTVTPDDVARHRVEGFAVHATIELDTAPFARLRLLGPDGGTLWERTSEEGPMGIVELFPEGTRSNRPLGERPNWPAGDYTLELLHLGAANARVYVVGMQDNSGTV